MLNQYTYSAQNDAAVLKVKVYELTINRSFATIQIQPKETPLSMNTASSGLSTLRKWKFYWLPLLVLSNSSIFAL